MMAVPETASQPAPFSKPPAPSPMRPQSPQPAAASPPPERTPPAPVLSSYIRPVSLAVLLLTLTPINFLKLLPLPHLHNPLTLICVLPALYAPTASARTMSTLLVLLALASQQLIVILHASPSARVVLVSRMLSCAFMGTLFQITAHMTVICAVCLLFWMACFLGAMQYAKMFLADGGTPEQLEQSPLMRLARQMQDKDMGTLSSFLVEVPATLVNGVTPALLVRGYAAMVVGPAGTVVDHVSIIDIIAYALAGMVGITLVKVVLPLLWSPGSVKTTSQALSATAKAAYWILVNSSSAIFVALSLAERDILLMRSSIISAVFMVTFLRFAFLVLEVLSKSAKKHGFKELHVILLVLHVLCASWFLRNTADRLLDALAAEAHKNAVL